MPCCLVAAARPALGINSLFSICLRLPEQATMPVKHAPPRHWSESRTACSAILRNPSPSRDPIRLSAPEQHCPCPATTRSLHRLIASHVLLLNDSPAIGRDTPRCSTNAPRFGSPRPKPFFAILAGQTGSDGSLAWTPSS
ncbi:hypothetical protein TgHK011_003289 [Trichoderma gracile]|nr:hypothetical protein TgHK011_003289 [Trichoderma gracile]